VRRKMIYGVWIIHGDGKCLFYREFKNLDINEQLFSGFMAAMLAFSKEISSRQLKSMNLEDFSLYYEGIEEKRLYFVVAADPKERESNIREKIELIEEAFLSDYGEILANWDGNIALFRPFDSKVDTILDNRGSDGNFFDFSFLSKASLDNIIKKFALLLGRKDKQEIEELDHTIGVLEDFTHDQDRFHPPQFLIEAPQKMRLAWKRILQKLHIKPKD
jgi:hypothetical protein